MILVVAAVAEELGDLAGEPLGLGQIPAAARMSQLLAERRPSGVLLLGTGGAFGAEPTIGTACVARRVGLAHGVAVMGLGYVPQPPSPVACDLRLVSRLDLPIVDLLGTHAITTDPVLAGRLADGWHVEHSEAYGAAYACALFGVPFAAVVGIASRVGRDAHAQWLSNKGKAREAVWRAVRPVLRPESSP